MLQNPDKPIDSPTAWFAALERARRTDDRELALKAVAELERLGVSVIFEESAPPASDRSTPTARPPAA